MPATVNTSFRLRKSNFQAGVRSQFSLCADSFLLGPPFGAFLATHKRTDQGSKQPVLHSCHQQLHADIVHGGTFCFTEPAHTACVPSVHSSSPNRTHADFFIDSAMTLGSRAPSSRVEILSDGGLIRVREGGSLVRFGLRLVCSTPDKSARSHFFFFLVDMCLLC